MVNQAVDMAVDTVNKLINNEEKVLEAITNSNHIVIK